MPKRQLVGHVIGDKMQKTVVVSVQWLQHHSRYRKALRRTSKLYVHDPKERSQMGDLVRVEETRPISRLKRWLLLDVLERRERVALEQDSGIAEVLASEEAAAFRITTDAPTEEPAAAAKPAAKSTKPAVAAKPTAKSTKPATKKAKDTENQK